MSFFLRLADLTGQAAISVATGRNAMPGMAFAEHRTLATLRTQGAGPWS